MRPVRFGDFLATRFLVDLAAAFLLDFFFGEAVFLEERLAPVVDDDFLAARFFVERVAEPAVFFADRAAVDFFVAMYMAPPCRVP
ncbi:MAG: hypothetical protein O3C60_08400 [Planctomycetota bacterium]|nr:hypothetical protein [Planctomycetota bacterium]